MKKSSVTKSDKVFNLRDKIYQSNPLIQARKDFNIIGTRLFFLGLRGVNPQLTKGNRNADVEFKPLFISSGKLREILGNGAYFDTLKKECEKLSKSIVKLNYEHGFKMMSVFASIEYKERDGLYLEFSSQMRPYLLDLFESGGYTVINVEQVFLLSSTYSVRLVELMLQYQNIKVMKQSGIIERLIKMDELRFMLNVPDGTYEGRLDNFCSNVLNSPIREINEKTLYKMSYETVKLEHKQIAFQFTFDMTAVMAKEMELNAYSSSAIGKLRALGFSSKAAQDILDRCDSDEDCLKRITRATRSLSMKRRLGGTVDNELGYLRKYIEENWQSAATKAKHNRQAKRSLPPPISEVLPQETAPSAKPKAQKKRSRKSVEPEPAREVFDRIFPSVKPAPQPTEEDRAGLPEALRVKPVRAREPAAEEFRDGEQPLIATVADIAADALSKGEMLETIQALLESRGFTIERFRELYMT